MPYPRPTANTTATRRTSSVYFPSYTFGVLNGANRWRWVFDTPISLAKRVSDGAHDTKNLGPFNGFLLRVHSRMLDGFVRNTDLQ